MGTWGTGILHDDATLDVYEDYSDRWSEGDKTPEAIWATLEIDHASALDDDFDRPKFWIALARAQWECGVLQADVVAKVAEIVSSGSALVEWEEAFDPKGHGRRKDVLTRFRATLRNPCARPRRRPRKTQT